MCSKTLTQDIVNLSSSIRDFLDALVHPSAREDVFTAERHLAFMVPRLFGSLIALGVFPVFLALRGVPSALEFSVLAWMIAPIFTACFLSRTGRYDAAQGLSAVALTGIVTIVAANSGGINSFGAIWLAFIPLEAALSGSRRAVVVAAVLAICGAGLLIAAGAWFDLGPGAELSTSVVAALGIFSAVLYAIGIAFGGDSLVRANFTRPSHETDQFRLLAFSTSDVVTHHDQGGRVVYASANAQSVLGAPGFELRGYGLLDRIHIADRPAYLRALSEAAETGDICEIEFRLRRNTQAEFVWIEMRCRPVDGQLGRNRAATRSQVVAVMRDVTLRKIQQEALVAARTKAERANTAKSRFLAVLSHELLTPLNAILGFSSMLCSETEVRIDSTRQLEYARLINESGHRLLAVVNEMLDMSRLERAADSRCSLPIASGMRSVTAKGLPGRLRTPGDSIDPSVAQPASMNPPANLQLPVQKRA